ncbi:oxidoreductase [Gracilibacillus boraciitolerans JCM 21714]|uniref:Oxidoreductase n=1 Tax=Gracilibacillus boraciitolerans JCM 21714 TaxID=1298598 RepID=W4VGA4_9BACI|nr:oxidoreductase [Gracilibacillus boraciitolerans JCM 21714]
MILRWDLQQGIITIPKSVKKQRIQDNADVFDFELTEEEMKLIANMNKEERIGPDPDAFNKR